MSDEKQAPPPRDLLEAYERTLIVVGALKTLGIPVDISPSKSGDARRSSRKADERRQDALPVSKWVNVEFTMRDEEVVMIREAAKALIQMGISFDTDDGFDHDTKLHSRGWHLDWSFQFLRGPGERAIAALALAADREPGLNPSQPKLTNASVEAEVFVKGLASLMDKFPRMRPWKATGRAVRDCMGHEVAAFESAGSAQAFVDLLDHIETILKSS